MEDSNVLTLSDGRKLGYADYGVEDGFPILCFHGTPSSRIHPVTIMLDKLSHQSNKPFRIISIDRPGFGLSDALPDRTLLDWPKDVKEATEFLNIEKFAVLGISGGGPFALACNHLLAPNVTRTAILAGVGPIYDANLEKSNELEHSIKAAFHAPGHLKEYAENIYQDPAAVVKGILESLPDEDRNKIPTEMVEVYKKTLTEATRSSEGIISDYAILGKPWGFDISELDIPTKLWHSDADTNVPYSHAEYIANNAPNVKLAKLHGLSHFSSVLTPIHEVISYLLDE